MKVQLLGTGNPVPSLKRASSGYLIRKQKDIILFDHGPGTHWRLLQAGVKAVDVTHIFISHLHYDHCVDFIRLYLNRWDQGAGKIAPLKMYGPPGFQRFVDCLFGPEGAFNPDLTARTSHPESLEIFRERGGKGGRPRPETEVTELRESDVVEGDGWQLSLVNMPHHQPYLTCYGLRLETDEGTVVFTSDISHPFQKGEDGVPAYKAWDDPGVDGHYKSLRAIVKDADLLIQYLHLPNADVLLGRPPALPKRPSGNVADSMHKLVARIAQEGGVKRMVVTHLNPAIDQDGVRERVTAEMATIYQGVLMWGEDLMEIPVGEAVIPPRA